MIEGSRPKCEEKTAPVRILANTIKHDQPSTLDSNQPNNKKEVMLSKKWDILNKTFTLCINKTAVIGQNLATTGLAKLKQRSLLSHPCQMRGNTRFLLDLHHFFVVVINL